MMLQKLYASFALTRSDAHERVYFPIPLLTSDTTYS